MATPPSTAPLASSSAASPRQALPDCERARERSLSANTGACSLARTNLDSRVPYWAAEDLYGSLIDTSPPSWGDRRRYTLDGTTARLAPALEPRAAYPPASNQRGGSHWPILHLVTADELRSGLAVLPECGPMCGPGARGELSLTLGLLPRLPERPVLSAGRNFGAFAFAWAAAQAKRDVLARLTEPRFKASLKGARKAGGGKWGLTWRPGRRGRQSHPELPAGASVEGRPRAVKVSDGLTPWLFTTPGATGPRLACLYHKRRDVEADIRDLKETLLLAEMTAKGVAMVGEELVAAVLTYDLANQVRRLAAGRLKAQPRRLSFAGVWGLLAAFAQGLLAGETGAEAGAEFERLLRAAGQRKLPRRAKGRPYPREVIPRRRKSPTRKRAQNAAPR